MTRKLILSLFDYSGVWSQPYRDSGDYIVIRVDKDLPTQTEGDGYSMSIGMDIHEFERSLQDTLVQRPHGILAAPPCKRFSKVGARHWKGWDASGQTQAGLWVIDVTLSIIRQLNPAWWALENPPGRLANKKGTGLRQKELGLPEFSFDPWNFAELADDPNEERYTKRTYLWGEFNWPDQAPLEPEPYPEHLRPGVRDRHNRLPDNKDRDKLRSRTPQGFARAFFKANP